jgi:hypothetical protein
MWNKCRHIAGGVLIRTKINKIACFVLNAVGKVTMWSNSLVGNAYTKVWPTFLFTWFDHRFDYMRGPQNWHWLERGVFGNMVIEPGYRVLDLCSGDGIYSGLFYSVRASYVDAIDRDKKAISLAKKRYSKLNIRFLTADVLNDPFPESSYDVVFLFAAIGYFSIEDGTHLIQKIARALPNRNSVFVGSTPILPPRTSCDPQQHDRSQGSSIGKSRGVVMEPMPIEVLKSFLQPHFHEIKLWTSEWPTRTEAYFVCKSPRILTEDEIEKAIKHYRELLSPWLKR